MSIIAVNNLTKDYGNHKGIFNLSMEINKGEIYGFLGPNGAGKTTTIRNLMGFCKPMEGECTIFGKECFASADIIQKKVGYLAGEIVFPDANSGIGLLNFLAEMKGIKDKKRMEELIEMFELNASGKIKRMSKGMKQKVGIVNAFMGNPEVLILDEPTSGLDPLMQKKFVNLLLEEKKKGVTILMSSHIFEEVEKTCDRTAIIKDGKLMAVETMSSLQEKKKKTYEITLGSSQNAQTVMLPGFKIVQREDNRIFVEVENNLPEFFSELAKCDVKDINIHVQSLEDLFLKFYGKEEQ